MRDVRLSDVTERCNLRSNSIVSRSGRRIVKNPSRVGDIEEGGENTHPVKVPLFRLNSFIKDAGKKEDVGEEPERQQWDNPMEFLMSCISMSVGQYQDTEPVSPSPHHYIEYFYKCPHML